MIRLVPMSEEEYHGALERAIARHAASCVRRGEWTEEAALASSREELTGHHPQGRATPGYFFAKAIDERSGQRVGETWYSSKEQGGKVRFWVEWLAIDPPFQRQGFATRVLEALAEQARKDGADRMGLYVMTENPGAMALYTKMGFEAKSLGMVRSLSLAE